MRAALRDILIASGAVAASLWAFTWTVNTGQWWPWLPLFGLALVHLWWRCGRARA